MSRIIEPFIPKEMCPSKINCGKCANCLAAKKVQDVFREVKPTTDRAVSDYFKKLEDLPCLKPLR